MANLAAPTADQRTRLALIADPHVAVRSSGTSKWYEHTKRHFRAAITDARNRSPDAILSVGDLTKDGEPWNFDAVDEVLAGLEVPYISIPGNHDVPKAWDDHAALPVSEFASRYTPEGQGFPFRIRIGGIDLLGLNSAGDADRLIDTHDGEVDAEQLAWLADALDESESPIVLNHHNLPGMYDQYRQYREAIDPGLEMPPITRTPAPLVETLVDGGRPLVISGHYHIPAAAETDGVRELMAPATCSFPQAYLFLDVGPTGTTVWMVPVADAAGFREAHHRRATDSDAARALTAMAAIRLARFPLIND